MIPSPRRNLPVRRQAFAKRLTYHQAEGFKLPQNEEFSLPFPHVRDCVSILVFGDGVTQNTITCTNQKPDADTRYAAGANRRHSHIWVPPSVFPCPPHPSTSS